MVGYSAAQYNPTQTILTRSFVCSIVAVDDTSSKSTELSVDTTYPPITLRRPEVIRVCDERDEQGTPVRFFLRSNSGTVRPLCAARDFEKFAIVAPF